MYNKYKLHLIIAPVIVAIILFSTLCFFYIRTLYYNHLLTYLDNDYKLHGLSSNMLTNYIYFIIMVLTICLVVYGAGQYSAMLSTNKFNAIQMLFKQLYDEKYIIHKETVRKIKEVISDESLEEIKLLFPKPNNTYDKIKEGINIKIQERVGPDPKITINSAEEVANYYNNIAVLMKYEALDLDNLPVVFSKNVIEYWIILRPFICLRRDLESKFNCSCGDTKIKIKCKLYGYHYAELVNKCCKYLSKLDIDDTEINKAMSITIKDK